MKTTGCPKQQLLVLAACSLMFAANVSAASVRPFSQSVALKSSERNSETPWFCHSLECPKFSKNATLDGDIERRYYETSVWASTNVSNVQYSKAVRIGFERLFSYISGSNVEEQNIEMTAPVKVALQPSQGPFCKSFFTISFFVPFELQAKPPTPISKDVFIETQPAQTFYVSSYGGYTSDEKVVSKALDLVERLDKLGLPYNNEVFYSAGYDAPFRIINRHNEVWVAAAEAPQKVAAFVRKP